jgi:polysaccharide export outer membrane protein
MKKRILIALIVMFAGVAAHAEQTPSSPQEEDGVLVLEARPVTANSGLPATLSLARSDYKIGRQDLLEISVFDVEELDQTVRVADDGSITMPLLGSLNVSGLTKTELEQSIARLLAERYVRNPQVTVFVKEYTSKQIAVSGAVKKPGNYEMLGRKTLLEMISMAGGLDKDIGKQIIIFRQQSNGTTERIPIDLRRLVYAADPALNITVVPNDIIYVPVIEKVRIFVSGAVRNPDLYEVPRDEPVTLLKAITLAGGTTDRAAQKKVQIMRTEEDGTRITLVVNLKHIKRGKAEDPILHPDDIVLIPESFF